MILTPNDQQALLDLYIRCYGADDRRAACFLDLDQDQLRSRFFSGRYVFGTWHGGQLVSSITLRQSKYPNLVISEGWVADPACGRARLKLDCYRESQQYAWQNGFKILRVTRTRLLEKVWGINQNLEVGLHPFLVIERIPAGGLSRFAWINQRYFSAGPADEEWTVQLAE